MLAEFLFYFGMEPISLIGSLEECLDCLFVVRFKYKYGNLGHKLILAFDNYETEIKKLQRLAFVP